MALGKLQSLFDGDNGNITIVVSAALILFVSYAYLRRDDGGPPWLGETIPFVSNTIQMTADPVKFWNHAA